MTVPLLTVDQAATALGCEPPTVEAALRSGDLPGVQFGRSWVIPESALAARLHDKALEEAARRREAANEPKPRTAVLRDVKRKAPPALP